MVEAKPRVYFTDGEGPVVFKDLARDISQKRLPAHFFDVVSMWVANNSESSSTLFEPGDTLATIVPHLLVHNVTDEDLRQEAQDVKVASGIENLFAKLRSEGADIRIISTAYRALWDVVGPNIQIPQEHITSTNLQLDLLKSNYLDSRIVKKILETEAYFIDQKEKVKESLGKFSDGMLLSDVFAQEHMAGISARFDELYFAQLPNYDFPVLDVVRVVGGLRKIEAINEFAQNLGVEISDMVYTGDSITDDKALKYVKDNGGLAIALNGDRFAIRNATVAVATEDMLYIKPLLDSWVKGGLDEVKRFIAEGQFSYGSKERLQDPANRPARYSVVSSETIDTTVAIHKEAKVKIMGSSTPLL